MKKILLLIIVVAILLSLVSCKNNDLNSLERLNNMEDVHYSAIEIFKDLELDTLSEVVPFEDGKFLVSGSMYISERLSSGGRKFKHRYLLVDENGKILKELNIGNDYHFWTHAITLDNNNNIILLGFNDEKFLELLTYNMEVKLLSEEKVKIEEYPESDFFIKVQISEKGLIYGLTDNGDIFILDNKCNIIHVIDEKYHIGDFDILEENKILFVMKGAEYYFQTNPKDRGAYLFKYDVEQKEVIEKIKLHEDLSITKIKHQNNTNLIYSVDGKYISVLTEDGELKQKLINYYYDTSIAQMGDFYESGGIFEFENSLYMFGRKRFGDKTVFKIVETNKKEDRLVIAINEIDYWTADNLDNIIQTFTNINPHIKISIVQYDDISEEQFFQVMNTELMSGKGPDMFWGSFPFDAYMKEGYIVDMMDYMNSDNEFNNDEYIYNVVESSRVDEKQYVFPVKFNFPKLYANKRVLDEYGITIDEENWTYKDMEKIIKQICGGSNKGTYYSFSPYGSTDLFKLSIKSSIDYLIDFENKKVNFNTPEFRDLLETIKGIRDYEFSSRIHRNMLFAYCDWDDYYYKSGLQVKITSFEDYKLVKMPKWQEGSKRIFDASFAGINNNSKLKDEAWEFIKFLISEGSGILYKAHEDFSINKEADKWTSEFYLNGSNEISAEHHNRFGKDFGLDPDFNFTQRIPDALKTPKEHIDKLNEMIKERNYHSFLSLPINEEIGKFLYAEQDIEQTIRNIQNKVELYIGE